ncbi:enoyl-CoA hydratase/isomerase family protein [Planococcus glaciei]|uniref:enoyl-CoA hydratase/isomerase family protein n=1 Tax=Planococcus glaciei TaxID=459472 RepID=UPI001C72E9C6|nr:enoyl-CoA hydratase-related protein [Planococcus glaciei]MBX0315429.1 enoyl-CoA hydratase/isomerase family protein [Planococcus glaciei]
MFQNILLDVTDTHALITINRPEVRNALNAATLGEIEQALELCERNPAVNVIVFKGAGDKSFAAGADIGQLRERKMLDALVPGMQGTYKKIENCSKATIAAINGFALGGGCELALACDLRVAAESAKIGLPELNLGIIPGAGGTQRLSRIVGKGIALDMILTGRIISGMEAERIGLVSEAVPAEKLDYLVEQKAKAIHAKGPLAVKLAKLVVNRGYDVDLDTALLIEKMAQTIAFGTEDKVEGTAAFIEKRTPQFKSQ